jgi:bacterial leucyl aminopeptidase
MRCSATLLFAFAAAALACNFEASPDTVDNFIRLRSTDKSTEPLYTLEFADGSTRQVTDDERWALKRVSATYYSTIILADHVGTHSIL